MLEVVVSLPQTIWRWRERPDQIVEIHSNGAAKRHGVEAALKMDGSDDLSLAFVDMFKAKPRDTNDGHVQTN